MTIRNGIPVFTYAGLRARPTERFQILMCLAAGGLCEITLHLYEQDKTIAGLVDRCVQEGTMKKKVTKFEPKRAGFITTRA